MDPVTLTLAKRATIYSAAFVSTFGAVVLFWTWTAAHVLRPEIQKVVAEERIARVAADSVMMDRVEQMGRDRIYLLSVLEARDARERKALLAEVRKAWIDGYTTRRGQQ